LGYVCKIENKVEEERKEFMSEEQKEKREGI
jgi:hypothetical protein